MTRYNVTQLNCNGMPTGELFIKVGDTWKDAFTEWGVSFDKSSLSSLMAPVPLKDMITNRSRLEDGVRRIRTNRKVDERTLRLGFNMWANTDAAFRARYNAFMGVLQSGQIDIKVSHVPDTVYRCDYLSCQQFGVYRNQLAKFVLSVVESDPTNRSV